VLAAELGAALGEALDLQVLNGTGGGTAFDGLLNVAGATAVTYTDASPTAAEAFAKIGQLCAETADAAGQPVNALLLHPRRLVWLTTKLGYRPEWPAPPFSVPAMPATLGAGTNEDAIIALVRDDVQLYLGPLEVRVWPDVGSTTGMVRTQAFQFGALASARQPAAIGRLTGTGLAGVVW